MSSLGQTPGINCNNNNAEGILDNKRYISLRKHGQSGAGQKLQGHNLNKLGRGSLDDTTYVISRL